MALLFETFTYDFLALIGAIIIGLYIYFVRNFNYWVKLGIPYEKPTAFVGNFKEVVFQKISIGELLKRLYDEHKDTPYVGIFAFDRPGLLIRDLNLMKNILVKDAQHFKDRTITTDQTLEPMMARNLFTLKGRRWRQIRSAITPTFSSGKMKIMLNLVDDCGKELANYLHQATADGSRVDVRDTMARFTTDVIASCAFGIDSNSYKDPNAEFRYYLRKVTDFSIRKNMAAAVMFFSPALQKILKLKFTDEDTTRFIRSTVWSTVEYREKHGVIRKDFLNCLMELRNMEHKNSTANGEPEDDNYRLDGDDFVAQAFVFLAAGFETSSTTMSFALYELALNPNVQDRLRTEINQVLTKYRGEVTYEGIQEMSYLHMVVSETLRKYPILPFLDRKCNDDYELPALSGDGTIKLPAGISVYLPVWAIQKDPKYYPDPETFDPERFSEENKKNQTNFPYFPFGEGPRICIGMRFGLMQVKTGLIHILKQIEVSPARDTPAQLIYDPKSFLLSIQGAWSLNFTKYTVNNKTD